jgi:hypothetical protein
MEVKKRSDLKSYFSTMEDPRIDRTKQHKLLDILVIAICGVICGADGWVEIEEFGRREIRLAERLARVAQRDSVP